MRHRLAVALQLLLQLVQVEVNDRRGVEREQLAERPYKPAHLHQSARDTMFAEAERGLWDKQIVGEFFSMLQLREYAA